MTLSPLTVIPPHTAPEAGAPGPAPAAASSTLFEFLPIGAYRSSPDGRLLQVNTELARLNGYEHPQELLDAMTDVGQQWYVDPARREQFKAQMAEHGQVRHFVSQVRRQRTGEVYWACEHAHVLRAADGSVSCYEGTVEDITTEIQERQARLDHELQLDLVTSQIPGMVYQVFIPHQGVPRYLYVSRGAQDIYGLSPEAILADGSLLGQYRHPDDLARIAQDLQQIQAQANVLKGEYRIRLPDGSVKWIFRSSGLVAVHADGVERIGVLLDVTDRRQAEEALRERDAIWKLALECTGDGVWDWHIDTGVEIFSKRFKEIYGYGEQDIPDFAAELDRRTHPDDLARMNQDRQAHFDGLTPVYMNEHRVLCKDGHWKWVLSRGMVIERDAQGKPLRMVGTHTDISQRKDAEALIWRQAHYDVLTGLPNRRMMRDRLEQDIHRCQRAGKMLAVVFVDLDHFKDINDTLGHHHGDLLLVEAARRIRSKVRASDTVSRQGGDEFTLLLPMLDDGQAVVPVAQGIIDALDQPFDLEGEQGHISASLGITFYPSDATTPDDLLKNADQALYKAKGAGRNQFCLFTPSMQHAARQRLQLTHDLAHARELGQLEVVYQPIISLGQARVRQAEAYLRWNHPTLGMLWPPSFMPVAESTGRTHELGDWLFEQACTQLARWRHRVSPHFQISLNRTPAQFHQGQELQRTWLPQLQRLGLPADCLTVEITEDLLLHPRPAVTEQLLALRDAGVTVALDNFGTGYSALQHLQQYDIDLIKIDRHFVRGLKPGSKSLALCKAMTAMAHAMGMQVVAKGVQSADQLALLADMGCDYAQSLWLAPPMSARSLEAWLANHAARPRSSGFSDSDI